MKLIDLKNINLPTKKDEDFRKIDLKTIFEKEFDVISEYKLDNLELVQSKQISSQINEFFKINNNLDIKTYELNVKKDTKEPIVIVHNEKIKNSFNGNSLKINLSKGIKASIIELFLNQEDGVCYSINREFNIEDNAHLEYLKIQDLDSNGFLLTNYVNNLKNTASINHTNFEIGKGFSLNIYETLLAYQNSSIHINGYVPLSDNANSSSIFKTIHENENNESHIKYKHILNDKSRGVFEALSKVNEKAYYSKVHQNTDTILLSDDAVIFAKPHLEINIDELEASHGATTGSLDKEQILYLKSRGIDDELAKHMLLQAIENEILDTIQDDKLKDFIQNYKREDYV